jgi:enamine deaminase RidA (YjgF/YER057c/UK114 family)
MGQSTNSADGRGLRFVGLPIEHPVIESRELLISGTQLCDDPANLRPSAQSVDPYQHRKTNMTRRLISTGSSFEKAAGYSRAVVQGDWCFVAGTTGYDYQTMAMPEDVETQTRNCLDTIAGVLKQSGFRIDDVVRANYYITDASFADLVFPLLGEAFREIRPAATMVVCGLIKPEMKIEMEVTALRQTKL